MQRLYIMILDVAEPQGVTCDTIKIAGNAAGRNETKLLEYHQLFTSESTRENRFSFPEIRWNKHTDK